MKKIMLILLAAAAILLVGCSKGTLMENDRIGTNSLFIDPATIKICISIITLGKQAKHHACEPAYHLGG